MVKIWRIIFSANSESEPLCGLTISSSFISNHFHIVPPSRRHPRPAARTGRIARPIVASWSRRRPPPLYSARVNARTRKAGNVETRRRAHDALRPP
jgi:hypothetical protein